jgi:glycosyltransferase involved in cell wall biosynthesis
VEKFYPHDLKFRKMNKILILLFYYDRPKMVKNALDSINKSTYTNYEIAFIDDGSINPGREVAEKVLHPNIIEKTTFYNTNDSVKAKLKQGGSIFGKYANIAMEQIFHDIVIMLCDDDALTPGYLEYLDLFFSQNTEINHCYSKVLFYDPSIENYTYSRETSQFLHEGSQNSILNKYSSPTNAVGKFDASQVAWRSKCKVKFPFPQTRALDSAIFEQLDKKWGWCYPTQIYGQCKGDFKDQLGNRWLDDNNNEFTITNS